MLLLPQLKSQLQRHGLWAKKRFGQNFLVDDRVHEAILEAAELKPADHVIEVGAGTGLLTARLAPRVSDVTAIEYDRTLIPLLNESIRTLKNVSVLYEDALNFNLNDYKFKEYKLVANIPYYITSPLIKHYLMGVKRPKLIILLVQKEVAEKICGKTGKTVLTIETQIFGAPEIMAVVSRRAFYPAPQVDSAILRIRIFDKPKIPEKDRANFIRVLHAGYSQKRKKLSNSLMATLRMDVDEVRKIVKEAGLPVNARPEDLEVEDWDTLTKFV